MSSSSGSDIEPEVRLRAAIDATGSHGQAVRRDQYVLLWLEELGKRCRRPGMAFTWPVLQGGEARWAVRAAIDAVAAHAHGLVRGGDAHVLRMFSHSRCEGAPRQRLAAAPSQRPAAKPKRVTPPPRLAPMIADEGLTLPSAPEESICPRGETQASYGP